MCGGGVTGKQQGGTQPRKPSTTSVLPKPLPPPHFHQWSTSKVLPTLTSTSLPCFSMAVLSNHNHSSFRRCSSRHTLLSRRDRALSSSLQLSTALLSSVELLHLFPFSIFSPVAAQQLPYLPIVMTPIIDSSWRPCQLQYRQLSTLCWLSIANYHIANKHHHNTNWVL